MVKVVLDTNIWISAIFFGGELAVILEGWKKEQFLTVISQETFLELENKLMYWGKKLGSEKEAAGYVLSINRHALFFYPQRKLKICRDPKDNKFLEIAYEAGAKYLISGDKDLLELNSIRRIKIISPSVFIERLKR
ncbi:putative toxin-antitoxin system toxin component, PIN family [Candidatus Gottesmanbacteria bacterium]|nr:putative toxin-antitoxin system toxin component, PIN family [Candidatus Gottesmanbacteria bacterium]